jgi:hypothetical protein
MNLLRLRLTRNLALSGALLLGGVACNSTSAPSYPLGDVIAVVTDANGVPVNQVQVDLMLTDKATLWRTAVTGSDGKAQFGTGEGGVLVQDYLVFFPSQVQWKLADGETNYKPAKAVENQTVTVQFKLQKVVINPG